MRSFCDQPPAVDRSWSGDLGRAPVKGRRAGARAGKATHTLGVGNNLGVRARCPLGDQVAREAHRGGLSPRRKMTPASRSIRRGAAQGSLICSTWLRTAIAWDRPAGSEYRNLRAAPCCNGGSAACLRLWRIRLTGWRICARRTRHGLALRLRRVRGTRRQATALDTALNRCNPGARPVRRSQARQAEREAARRLVGPRARQMH